jgi:hypothetical protein
MKHAPREHQRIYLTFYLRIFEDDNFIGYLIDISKDGLMVMSELPLESGKIYRIKMKLPSTLEWKGRSIDDRIIEFGAECRWSKHDDVDKEFYLSGFSISDLSPEDNKIIQELIKEYKIR